MDIHFFKYTMILILKYNLLTSEGCPSVIKNTPHPHPPQLLLLVVLFAQQYQVIFSVQQKWCRQWVSNRWEIQQRALMGDTWAEGTGSFGSWWGLTEGKARKKGKKRCHKMGFSKNLKASWAPQVAERTSIYSCSGWGKKLPQRGGLESRERKSP